MSIRFNGDNGGQIFYDVFVCSKCNKAEWYYKGSTAPPSAPAQPITETAAPSNKQEHGYV
jgi:hypothetical protein